MKAWAVTDWSCESTVVVFAETRGRARAKGAVELEDEFPAVSVRRAPEFDGMEPQPSDRQMLAAGWWVLCGACEGHVSEETVVFGGETAYCSNACREQAERRAA